MSYTGKELSSYFRFLHNYLMEVNPEFEIEIGLQHYGGNQPPRKINVVLHLRSTLYKGSPTEAMCESIHKKISEIYPLADHHSYIKKARRDGKLEELLK